MICPLPQMLAGRSLSRGGTCSTNRSGSVLILIYLLTAIGLTPGGSSTVHIYTQTIRRTTKIYIEQHKKQYIEQDKNVIGTVRAVPRLGELYISSCET
jgi:hypothetical protein